MNFEANVPVPKQGPQAWMQADLRMVAKLLRLPEGVTITAVRADPADSQRCIIDLGGPGLSESGEVQANYEYRHTTSIEFTGWQKVATDE